MKHFNRKTKAVLVTILLTTLTVSIQAIRSKTQTFCKPCEGSVRSSIETLGAKFTPTAPTIDVIRMDLNGTKLKIDHSLSTMLERFGSTKPDKCKPTRNLIKKQVKVLTKALKKGKKEMYSDQVYSNATAIALTLMAVENHSKILYRQNKDDECEVDYKDIYDNINKLLCKMEVLNSVQAPNTSIECERTFVFKKNMKQDKRIKFVLCGLADASKMLDDMIHLLGTCTMDAKTGIKCPGFLQTRAKETKKKRGRGQRKRKGRRPRRRRSGRKKQKRNRRRKVRKVNKRNK